MRRRLREPVVDALRAVALLGVVLVNAQSYGTGPWGTPLGLPQPAESSFAAVVHAGVAALFQGKAYPVLAFLFGCSFALSAAHRGPADSQYRARRMGRLLALGVLHGLLVFAGDILTMYAVCGLLLLRVQAWRSAALLRLTKLALVLAGGVWLLTVAAVFLPGEAVTTAPPARYAEVTGWLAFLRLNAAAYVDAQVLSVAFFLPEVLALMLLGMLAARQRWLSHRRWARAAGALVRRHGPWALALNAAYGVAVWRNAAEGEAALWPWMIGALPLGWWLAAVWVAAGVRAWHRGGTEQSALHALAPLGRYTLTLYLALSLGCAVLFSGAGLGLPVDTLSLAAFSLSLWVVAAWLAPHAAAQGWPGPFEAWMNRT